VVSDELVIVAQSQLSFSEQAREEREEIMMMAIGVTLLDNLCTPVYT